jgi:multiple sugar transport system substrate-binding protein
VPETAQTDDGSNVLVAFGQDKIGMELMGPYGLGLLVQRNFDTSELGVSFVPGVDGGKYAAFGGGDSLVLKKGTPNKDVMLDFVSWAQQPENQIKYLMEAYIISPRMDLPKDQLGKVLPAYVKAWEANQFNRAPKIAGYDDIFNIAQGPWLQMLQKAIFDGDIDGAIADGQAGFTRVLERNKQN